MTKVDCTCKIVSAGSTLVVLLFPIFYQTHIYYRCTQLLKKRKKKKMGPFNKIEDKTDERLLRGWKVKIPPKTSSNDLHSWVHYLSSSSQVNVHQKIVHMGYYFDALVRQSLSTLKPRRWKYLLCY